MAYRISVSRGGTFESGFRFNPRYERWRWQTFGITWQIYASFYLTRQSFNAAKVVLAEGPLSFAREQLGRIDAKRGAGSATGFVNGVGSIGAILGGYLPGIMTDAKTWTPFLAISLAGIVLSAIILVPLWRVKPPTS